VVELIDSCGIRENVTEEAASIDRLLQNEIVGAVKVCKLGLWRPRCSVSLGTVLWKI